MAGSVPRLTAIILTACLVPTYAFAQDSSLPQGVVSFKKLQYKIENGDSLNELQSSIDYHAKADPERVRVLFLEYCCTLNPKVMEPYAAGVPELASKLFELGGLSQTDEEKVLAVLLQTKVDSKNGYKNLLGLNDFFADRIRTNPLFRSWLKNALQKDNLDFQRLAQIVGKDLRQRVFMTASPREMISGAFTLEALGLRDVEVDRAIMAKALTLTQEHARSKDDVDARQSRAECLGKPPHVGP
jgi:hypothetical protein